MSAIQQKRRASRSRISFDLADELSEAEIANFKKASKAAGAKSLTEHFLNLTLRVPVKKPAKAAK